MSKHRLILVTLAVAAVATVSGCVVAPVPGYGYGYESGYGHVASPPAVIVTPAPYARHRDQHYRRW